MDSTAKPAGPQGKNSGSQFALVPLWWFAIRPRITWRQLSIGVAILAHNNPRAPGRCYPSIDRLNVITGIDRRNIYTDIAKLESRGALRVVRSKGQPNHYFIPAEPPDITTTSGSGVTTTPSQDCSVTSSSIATPQRGITATPVCSVTTTPLTDQLTKQKTDQGACEEIWDEQTRREAAEAKSRVFEQLRTLANSKRMPGVA